MVRSCSNFVPQKTPRRIAFQTLAIAFVIAGTWANAQEVLLKEDFNTDGAGPRYTLEGRGVVPDSGAGGPAFWAHNFDVTKIGKPVGVPAVAPARRAIFLWNHNLDPSTATPAALELIDSTVNWLIRNKASARILFSPPAAGDGDLALVTRLTAKGHTVTDDDPSGPLPATNAVDLVIQSSSGVPTPTRFTSYAVPLLSYNGSNHDDELTSSIGATTTFNPGDVTIKAPAHPAAGGKTGTLQWVTTDQPLDTIGSGLPQGSTIVASYSATTDTGANEERPLLLTIEAGGSLLGGLISGQEGTGFFAGADMNEPTIADGTFNTVAEPRSLTLRSVNVTGKKNVKLTVALAATDVDFEQDDFLRILVDTDGSGPGAFTPLIEFKPPTANDKFFSDGTNKLSVVFKDVSYNIPDGATDLVVRFESMSTFFNEIVALDNVRITAGDAPPTTASVSIKRDGANLSLEFTGVLQSAASVTGPWTNVPNNPKSPFVIEKNNIVGTQFYRARNP